jgi:ATP/maltotriose-dependent transcriptional regulator MalT
LARELLERFDTLDTLDQALRSARDGHGRVVLLTGEAGIGKSSVLRTFRRSIPRDVRVLTGGCDDLLTPRALGPLRDAAAADPRLGSLLAGTGRDELFGALQGEFSGPPVTALLVEDLHWADDATLDVLGYLARRADRLHLVLVLTMRPDLLPDHPLPRMVGGLLGEHVIRLGLEPLSPGAVARLAGPTRWDAAAVHQITGGNPFYVTETLAVDPGQDVPETVAQAVAARTRALSGSGRSALQTLSVLPGAVEIDLAEAVLGDQLAALDESEQLGMLEVGAGGIRFRHELARRAVQAGLPRLRRRSLHRRVVGALLNRGRPDVPRLVHHAIQADDADTVIRYAPAAGRDCAAAGSHRQALRHFEAALRYSDRLTPPAHARLLDDYAWELYNAHRFAEAVRLSDRAVGLFAGSDDRIGYGEALVRQSRHRYMAGDTEDAIASANAGAAVLCATDRPAGSAFAMTNLGSLLALGGDPDRASATLDEAARLAEAGGRPDLVALCLNYQSIARPALSDRARIDLLVGSRHRSVDHGAHEYTARAYTNTAELLYRFLRFDELQACVDAGLAFTAEHGFRSHAYNLEVHRCLLQMRRGNWAAAEHGLVTLVEQLPDPGMLQLYSRPPLARLRMRRDPGDDDAGETLQHAWRRSLHQRSLLGLAFAGTALVEWAWLRSRPDVARLVVDEWLPHAGRPTAAPITGELLSFARLAGVDVPPAVDVAEPWASALRGEWASAGRAWWALGDSYQRALCLWQAGDVTHGLVALGLLNDLGAHAPARLVRDDLRSRGVQTVPRGPQTRTRDNPAGLTDRQLAVLRLAARGRTNQQIADEMVLSVRTVEHHMSTVLAKFGVGTRQEAAEIAASWGDLPALRGVSAG